VLPDSIEFLDLVEQHDPMCFAVSVMGPSNQHTPVAIGQHAETLTDERQQRVGRLWG